MVFVVGLVAYAVGLDRLSVALRVYRLLVEA